jgi:hypothetical protein
VTGITSGEDEVKRSTEEEVTSLGTAVAIRVHISKSLSLKVRAAQWTGWRMPFWAQNRVSVKAPTSWHLKVSQIRS